MIKRILLACLAALAIVTVVNLTIADLPDKPPAPGKFVDVAGKRIHYLETPGRGIPVVMIHGMPGTALDWQQVTPLLKGIHTIAIDRPGYGWSEGGPASYQQQIEIVHEMLGKLGIERAVFVGHSFGGTLTLGIARKHPEDVIKMVLVAPGAGERRIPFIATAQGYFLKALEVPVFEQVSDLVYTNIALRTSGRIGADQAFSPYPVNDAWWQRTLAVTMTDGNREALANDRIHFNGETGPWVDANAPLVKTPGVEIAALKDKLVPIENARILDKQLRNSKLIEVPGGHMIPYSQPGRIALEIKNSMLARVAAK